MYDKIHYKLKKKNTKKWVKSLSHLKKKAETYVYFK